ncbi:MAG TPA: LacI family DNA-binding transcriptional regulator [Thermoflexales bacterium]|nr:LacI family DNA-binding transcriptional regulator [Anaerolineae bacterium]HQV28558.1 LacI family DNA-binding transcriptional regulator [Thermoflexales bacterium]HQX09434.1 LacI family DNA-binding transcriptional regulator [Thermoflexales bacterium]HQY25635.1 LacI family DNA-binding transcriptional regulator [Thermoflexales bacterium]HQZ52362.1 LacI family DNA-binding transcriptional regulator [Thermoflexales bacterium]
MKLSTKRVTIVDVASKSGVSKSTVSRVLRGDGDVSEDVRLKVTRAAKRMNYQPSVFARSLRSQRSQAIGLIIPDIANPFFPEVVRSIQNTADARGYTVLLANSDWHVERERKYLDFARRYHLDGIIINPVSISPAELKKSGCPVVVIGSRAAYGVFDTVASDTLGSITCAVDHLVARGHVDLALIAGPIGNPGATVRARAFRESIAAHGLAVDEARILWFDFTRVGGQAASRALAAAAPRPTAVVCGNDLIAIGLMAGLRDAGVDVPGDLSVIGIDDIDAAAMTFPPLTSVSKDKTLLGARAATLLIDRIEGKLPDAPARERLDTTLIERSSVAPPRANERRVIARP